MSKEDVKVVLKETRTEVSFYDLSQIHQIKLYTENPEQFEEIALKSNYDKVRLEVLKNTKSNKVLNDALKEYCLSVSCFSSDVLKTVKQNPNFKIEDETRKQLIFSADVHVLEMIASDEETSNEILHQIFEDKVLLDTPVIRKILENPNFKIDSEEMKVWAKSEKNILRAYVVGCKEASNEFLNKMLINEAINFGVKDVYNAILSNPNFKMSEVTWHFLENSEDWRYRRIAARYEGASSEFLKTMFFNELEESRRDVDVFKAIIQNQNFEISDEVIQALFDNHIYCDVRQFIAVSHKISEKLLAKVLYYEIANEKDEDVINAVLNNSKFREFLKSFAE